MKKLKGILVGLALFSLIFLLAACGQDTGGGSKSANKDSASAGGSDDKLRIGLSVTDLSLERWQHDRDIFVEKAEELGAEVIVQSADNDESKQLTQIQNMLSQGVDVLVVIPVNSDSLSPAIDQAKKKELRF